MTSDHERKKKRTRVLINVRLQYRYVGFVVLALVVISLVMCAFLYYNSYSLALELRDLALGNEQLEEQLRNLPAFFIVRMLIAMVAVIIAVIIIGILEMHKIAGPLFRLTRQVIALAEGNYRQRFTLRDKDELKELATALSELQSDLQKREAALALRLDKVSQKVEEFSRRVEAGTFEKKLFQEEIAGLNTMLEEMKRNSRG